MRSFPLTKSLNFFSEKCKVGKADCYDKSVTTGPVLMSKVSNEIFL